MLVPAEQSNAIVSPSGGPNGGPSTREGKEVACWNATHHGIRSPAPVVPGAEEAKEWEDHRDGFLDSLSPVGHLELVLAERAALLSWRLRHVIRFETESIALYQERVEDDLARERRFESGPTTPKLYAATPRAPEKNTGSLNASPRWKTISPSPL